MGSGVAGLREGSGHAVFNAQSGYAANKQTRVTLAVSKLTDRRHDAWVDEMNAYNSYGPPRSLSLAVQTHFQLGQASLSI